MNRKKNKQSLSSIMTGKSGTLLKLVTIFGLLTASSYSKAADCYGSEQYGTYCRLFHSSSPWNIVPINPTFSTFVIPADQYYPQIAPGAYSTGVFKAKPTDTAMVVYGDTVKGLWNPDAEAYQPSITIPRWPVGAEGASGSDGHCDIVDSQTGIIHSFWRLKKDATGKFVATQYAWSKLGGRGFGDPAHYFQGARAAGVPTSGGVIRKHEINDGKLMYNHALAMSLTYGGAQAVPSHIFPATSGDKFNEQNYGKIPEGARVMLPAGFDPESLQTVELRKIARTLKVYGALVVDRNYGTPFVIYVENGSGYTLHPGKWNSIAATELQILRANLRMMTSAAYYRAGAANSTVSELYNGAPVGGTVYNSVERSTLALNYLSMRRVGTPGFGRIDSGDALMRGVFDTHLQGLRYPASAGKVQQSYQSNQMSQVSWGSLVGGAKYKMSVTATGGATVGVLIGNLGADGKCVSSVVATGNLGHGQTSTIVMPAKPCNIRIISVKPAMTTPIEATVSPTFVRVF